MLGVSGHQQSCKPIRFADAVMSCGILPPLSVYDGWLIYLIVCPRARISKLFAIMASGKTHVFNRGMKVSWK